MATNSPVNGIRIVELTDGPADIEEVIGNVVTDIDRRMIPTFATTAARDLAIPSPTEGMACYVSVNAANGRTLQVYTGGSWVPHFRSPVFVRKSSSLSRLSGAGYSADPQLLLPVVANSVYHWEFHLYMFAASSADIGTRIAFPTGAETSFGGHGPHTTLSGGSTQSDGDWRGYESDSSSPTAELWYGTSDLSNRLYVQLNGLATIGATAGNITLEWRNLSDAVNGAEILAGSYGLATRLA